jgi:putative peptidoglycan lipid II flippase
MQRGWGMNQDVMDGIRRSTLVIVGLTLVDKVMALAKEMLFAYRFGVSRELDVFNVAYAFPAILAMLLGQAVIAAVVPLYMDWRERGPRVLQDHLATLGYAAVLFFLLLTLICFFWAAPIMEVIGYGFPEGEQVLGKALEQLLVWLILIEGGASILAGILQAKKSFAALYGAQLCINAGIIGTLIFLGDLGVRALVIGFLIGTSVKALVMILALRGQGFSLRPPRASSLPALREFIHLAWPLVVGGLVVNSNILVDQVMSTVLPAGSVSALRYAFRINELPQQLFVVALSAAIFPFISEQAEARDIKGMRQIFWRGVLFICMVSLAVTATVVLFSREIVAILLERGAFGPEAVESTALTLVWYSSGMIFSAYAMLNGMFFYALRKNKPLMIVGVFTMVVNAAFNALFIKIIGGPESIAISTAITMALTSLVFLVIIQKILGVFNDMPKFWPFIQIVCVSLLAFVIAGVAKIILNSLGLKALVVFPLAGALFFVVFLGSLHLSRDEQIHWCLGILLPWKKIIGRGSL